MSRAAQIYDFTLAAGASVEILAEGSYYRILSATGALEVKRDGGSRLAPLYPGQGERDEFKRITIRDLSGAANSGFIIVADGSFIDDRITGEVSVIDGEKTRSLAGLNITANIGCAAVAAQYAHVQLWNPSTDKNLIVSQVDLMSAANTGVVLTWMTSALANLTAGGVNNKKLSASGGIAQVRYQNNAAALTGNLGKSFYLTALSMVAYPLRGPYVVPPGYGLTAIAQTLNVNLLANFDVTEEAI